MCVPYGEAGAFATASGERTLVRREVGEHVDVRVEGDDRDREVGLRCAMKARAAAIASAIGLPFMLSDASISRIAPLEIARGLQAEAEDRARRSP